MIGRLISTIVLYITAGGLQALMGDKGSYGKLEVMHDADCGQYKAILRSDIGAVRRVASGPTKDAAIRNLIDLIVALGGPS